MSLNGCSLLAALWSELQLQQQQTHRAAFRILSPLWGCKQSLWRPGRLNAQKEIWLHFSGQTWWALCVHLMWLKGTELSVSGPPIFCPQHLCAAWRCSPLALCVVLGWEELDNQASPTPLGLGSGVRRIKAGITMVFERSVSPVYTAEFRNIWNCNLQICHALFFPWRQHI